MGKTTEDIKMSLNVSLKGSPVGVFQIKKLKSKFLFKIRKNIWFYPKIKNWHFHVKSGFQLWKES